MRRFNHLRMDVYAISGLVDWMVSGRELVQISLSLQVLEVLEAQARQLDALHEAFVRAPGLQERCNFPLSSLFSCQGCHFHCLQQRFYEKNHHHWYNWCINI